MHVYKIAGNDMNFLNDKQFIITNKHIHTSFKKGKYYSICFNLNPRNLNLNSSPHTHIHTVQQ